MPSLNTGNAILSNAIAVDSSYNVGIGGAASGSYKLQVTGTGNFTGALSGTTATFIDPTNNSPLNWSRTGGPKGYLYSDGDNIGITNVLDFGAGYEGILLATSTSSINFYTNGVSTPRLAIASNGAATFSNSVTSGLNGFNALGAYGFTSYEGAAASGKSINFSLAYFNSIDVIYQSSGNTNDFGIWTNGGTSSQPKLYIKNGGNIIIGGTTAQNNFATRGNLTINGVESILNLSTSDTNAGYLFHNATNMFLVNSKNGSTIFSTNDAQKMSITSGYSVSYKSNNASNATFDLDYEFSSPISARIRFATTTSYNLNEPGEISFWTRANDSQGGGSITERMRITSGGVTLFGGTTFTTITSAVLGATNPSFTGRNWSFGPNSSGDYVVYHNQGGGNTGVYLSYGGSSWTSNSDENIKDIIEIIPNALESIINFRAVKFCWKGDESKKENIGLIAQDVQKSYPELIDKQIFDDKEILGVRYTELIPILVKAIQELTQKVENQQQTINSLINR
jgi:hypothetical protein